MSAREERGSVLPVFCRQESGFTLNMVWLLVFFAHLYGALKIPVTDIAFFIAGQLCS